MRPFSIVKTVKYALGGIRTPGRRGTGNHRSIQLSYERTICFLNVSISNYKGNAARKQ